MNFLDYLRQQARLPPDQRDPLPPEATAAEIAEQRADLERRIQADIDAATPPRPLESGVLHIPQAMLDTFGLVEMDR